MKSSARMQRRRLRGRKQTTVRRNPAKTDPDRAVRIIRTARRSKTIRIRSRTIRTKRNLKIRTKTQKTKAAIKTLRITAKKMAMLKERKIPTIPVRPAIAEAAAREAESLLLTSQRLK